MSKIAKKIVDLTGVKYEYNDTQFTVIGNLGTNIVNIPNGIKLIIEDNNLIVDGDNLALAGTINRLVNNAVNGVKKLFEKKLQMVGVGYKGSVSNNIITFNVGYSHPILVNVPEGITVKFETPTRIILTSINKEKVGNFNKYISTKVRKYNVYSGKGILEDNVFYRRKETKRK